MAFTADSELSDFLASLGLSRYVPLFDADEVDMETLSLLQSHDYEQMGVPRGPRLRIQAALGSAPGLGPSSHGTTAAVSSPRPLYDRIASSGRVSLGGAAPVRTSPPPQAQAQARTVGQQQHIHLPQLRQEHAAGMTAVPPALPAHSDVSRILNLSPQSAAASFAATKHGANPTILTDRERSQQEEEEEQRKALSPMELEAREFLGEMDSLLVEARERLQKRSSRQLSPAAGVSNLSTISRSSGQQYHYHHQQQPSRDREPSLGQPARASDISMRNDSSLIGDERRAASATASTAPFIPAIFNTELTSSSDENDDDDAADLAIAGRNSATGRAARPEITGIRSPVPDQELQKEAPPDEFHARQAVVQQNLTHTSASKVVSTATGKEQASDGDQITGAADEAETVRLEIVALAAKRSPEQTSADRSAPQIERTVYVGHLPEALAFYDVKLKALFQRFGEVISVTSHHVTVHHRHDSKHHRSKNWGLVSFADALSAREAVRRGVEVEDKDEDGTVCKLLVRSLDSDEDQDALHIHHQQHLAKTDAQDDLGWLA